MDAPHKANDAESLDHMVALNIWGSGNLLIPLDMGRAAHHGLALWSATRRRATIARSGASFCLKATGPRLVPGRRVPIRWPEILGLNEWREMVKSIETLVGPFEHVVSYRPPQETRSGMAFLIVGSRRPLAFVKIRERRDPSLDQEKRILQRLRGGSGNHWTPSVLGTGTTATWRFMVTDPLPSANHNPCFRLPSDDLVAWYQGLIREVLRDPTEEGYLPMHGDFAPWNVRALRDGRIAIIDWEDAGWGPPGADLAYLSAAARALGRLKGRKIESTIATAFWRSQLMERRPTDRRDQALRARMLAALPQP